MTIETICTRCIEAVTNAGYSDATIFNYKGVIRRFKTFCSERGVTDYSSEIGKQYAADVISKKTGKFSLNRCHTQGRFFRLIDSYNRSGAFDFSMQKHGKIQPNNPMHQQFMLNIRDIWVKYMIMIIRFIFMSMVCIVCSNS